MEEKIQDLIEISHFYGSNLDYVIAGGGNTSFKNDKRLWIKASGIALSIIQEDGFVCLSRERLGIISKKKYSDNPAERENEVKTDLLDAIVKNNGKRPSVETSLHELVGYSFVVHTHPTLVNSVLCSKNAKETSFELFGEDILYIEYTDPGYVLFKKVADELNYFRLTKGFDPKIILLENHGIIVSSDTIDEIKEIYTDFEVKILDRIEGNLPSTICQTLDLPIAKSIVSYYPDNEKLVYKLVACRLANNFVKDEKAFEEIRTAFTPDHIVYCKSRYLFIDGDLEGENSKIQDRIKDFYKLYGYFPKIIGIKNTGLLIIEENEESVNTVQELILNMMKICFHARAFGGSKPMTCGQIDFIENWEAENYRRKMAKG